MERDYVIEQKAAVKELEEKKSELKENLLLDIEEKRKLIETERCSLELTGDSTEVSYHKINFQAIWRNLFVFLNIV